MAGHGRADLRARRRRPPAAALGHPHRQLINGKTPDLWALFGGLAHLPLLLVRGEVSDILLPATVARMQAMRPDMTVAALPDIGHAPTLAEPRSSMNCVTFLTAWRDRLPSSWRFIRTSPPSTSFRDDSLHGRG